MLPLSLLFLAVAITDPSGSRTTAPTALSLTNTPRNLCAGLKPSGIMAICIEPHAGMSLLRVIGSLTHTDTTPLALTPHIRSCDDMFVINATNEVGDTESRSDVKHGYVADRASPRVLVEVHPCAGECAISVKRCPHQAERPIVIGVRLHDSNGRVPCNLFESPDVFKNIARCNICIWACVLDRLEKRSGYGMLFGGNIDQRSDHPVSIVAIRFICYVNGAFCINPKVCNEISILRGNETPGYYKRFRKSREQLYSVSVGRKVANRAEERQHDNITRANSRYISTAY